MIKLLEYMKTLPAGPITKSFEVEKLLSECWVEFNNSGIGGAGGMKGYKLHGRMEEVKWNPTNILTFVIERHGGTVAGSTRAELQKWTLDLEKKTADYSSGYRQLYPTAPRLKIKPIVEEITKLILNRQEDPRLIWNKDGSVRIYLERIISSGGFERTVSDRRKRFKAGVSEILINAGWIKIVIHNYFQWGPPPETAKNRE